MGTGNEDSLTLISAQQNAECRGVNVSIPDIRKNSLHNGPTAD